MKQMKQALIVIIGFLMFINIVSAVDCQYPSKQVGDEKKNVFYINDVEVVEELLEIQNFKQGFRDKYFSHLHVKASFRVFNNYEKPIWLRVFFTKNGVLDSEEIVVQEYGYESVVRGIDDRIDSSTIRFEILNKNISSEYTFPTTYICILKDDGESCSRNSECGGGYCVEGYCSNTALCYNNNCRCALTHIQCTDNKKCVLKGVVPLGVRPECNMYQECVSQYINQETGLCEKSPTQLQEEEAQKLKEDLERKEKKIKELSFFIITVILLVTIGVISRYVLKNKNEKERQHTLQKEIDLEGIKIERLNKELADLQQQRKSIRSLRHKSKRELDKLRKINIRINKLNESIEKAKKRYNEPYPSKYVNLPVWRNPEMDYYECFYNKNDKNPKSNNLVHRWVWKKHNGRKPRPGYHIHHKDGDKYNNHPNNLEELHGEEHYHHHRHS